jgi:MFS family permease
VISAASLAIITTSFEEGASRNRALGVWGALGGLGATSGVLLGGVLTQGLGWPAIFLINVPIGLAVVAFGGPTIPEGRGTLAHRHFDVTGALLVTGGMVALVYGIVRTDVLGWGSAGVLVPLVVGVVLLIGFGLVEGRLAKAPLMPLGIFRNKLLSSANATMFLMSGSMFANFFILTLYMQTVLHYSALQAGGAFVATAGTAVAVAGPSQALVTRLGPKPVMVAGLTMIVLASLWYTRLSVDYHYFPDLVFAFVLYGAGIALAFIPVSISALAGVASQEAGLASGLINTGQQIGGAIGVAIVSTVAATRTDDLLNAGTAQNVAFTEGFQRGYWVVVLVGAAALAVALLFVRHVEAQAAEAALEGAPSA